MHQSPLLSQRPCPSTLWAKRRLKQGLGLGLRLEVTAAALVLTLALEVIVVAARVLTPEVGAVRIQEVLLALGPILARGVEVNLEASPEAGPAAAVDLEADLAVAADLEACLVAGLAVAVDLEANLAVAVDLEVSVAAEVAATQGAAVEATRTVAVEVGVVDLYNNNRWMKATTLKAVVEVSTILARKVVTMVLDLMKVIQDAAEFALPVCVSF